MSDMSDTNSHKREMVQRSTIATLWSGLMRGIRPWFVLSSIFVRELRDEPVETQRDNDVRIRLATREDLDRAAAQLPEELVPARVDEALSRGDICLAAFHGERMVSFVWRSFARAPHDGLWVEVERPYWYTYKSYTQPEFRGQRLSGLLTLFGDQVCKGSGLKRGVGFIETHNYSSIRANVRLGSRLVGYAGYLKLFGRTYPFRTPGVVPHTFRFHCAKDDVGLVPAQVRGSQA